eukprot:7387077-Prymnesium_polylepis.1
MRPFGTATPKQKNNRALPPLRRRGQRALPRARAYRRHRCAHYCSRAARAHQHLRSAVRGARRCHTVLRTHMHGTGAPAVTK